MITVKQILADQTRPLRHLVLWPHIENESDCVIDIDNREDAIHLGAFLDNNIVGVCSLFRMESPRLEHPKQYRLRAMATHPDVRGMHAGQAIVEHAIEQIRSMGYDVLWCDARKIALGFYEKMGFTIIDEWYEVRNIGPHKTAFIEL